MKRNALTVLVVNLETPNWSPSCWITRFQFCVWSLSKLMNLMRWRSSWGGHTCGFLDVILYQVQKWDAMIRQCCWHIWRHHVGARIVGSYNCMFGGNSLTSLISLMRWLSILGGQTCGSVDSTLYEVQAWNAMRWQCWWLIWRRQIGAQVVGSHVFSFAFGLYRNWWCWWDSGQVGVVTHVDLLILYCTNCRNETQWFGNVGGTFGGLKFEPEFVDHTFSVVRLVLAEINEFHGVAVNVGWSKVWICWCYIAPSAKMRRHDSTMLVVHLEATN